MIIAASLFVARFINVSAAAFQQKSVIGNKYIAIPVTCYIRATCDYISWGLVAYSVVEMTSLYGAMLEIFFMGAGSTLGGFSGMLLYDKVFKK